MVANSIHNKSYILVNNSITESNNHNMKIEKCIVQRKTLKFFTYINLVCCTN